VLALKYNRSTMSATRSSRRSWPKSMTVPRMISLSPNAHDVPKPKNEYVADKVRRLACCFPSSEVDLQLVSRMSTSL